MPEGSVPSPLFLLRAIMPRHVGARLHTEQLVAGIRHPDLNLPALNH